jgi:hypothetical protein
MPNVGDHQPCTSRYKCMTEFLRPRQAIKDKQDNVIGFTEGNLRTTCVLPVGHDGPCANVRGETAGPMQITKDQARLKALEKQVKALMSSKDDTNVKND